MWCGGGRAGEDDGEEGESSGVFSLYPVNSGVALSPGVLTCSQISLE